MSKKDDKVNNNSMSKTNTNTPKTKTNTNTNTSTPKTKTKTNTSTPKTNTSTPKTNTSTPKTKTNTSTPKTKANTTTPKTNTTTSKTNTPKTNTSTPKTNDKVDIENHRSELHKTNNNIKTILDWFVFKKFMNKKFITRNLDKDGISLCSINNSMKGVKIINTIAICRDLISLVIEKNTKAMKQDMTISIDDEKIILNTSQADDYNGIKKKLNMSISIHNDKITSNISMTNENFTKDVNKEIEYTNKIRYVIIMKIMYWLIKIC